MMRTPSKLARWVRIVSASTLPTQSISARPERFWKPITATAGRVCLTGAASPDGAAPRQRSHTTAPPSAAPIASAAAAVAAR
jgi:hypothetical protein